MLLILIAGILINPVISNENRPILQELLLPKNLAQNRTVRLNCNLLQGEGVKFKWLFNDQLLHEKLNKIKILYNEESTELLIKGLQMEDLGEYKCIGSNRHGQDTQKLSLYFNSK